MSSISLLRCYVHLVSMPLDELKVFIANGAAQEAERIGVDNYHCVVA